MAKSLVAKGADFSLEVARTGLGEAEAADTRFDAIGVTTESTTRAGYYPGAKPIRVKLVASTGATVVLSRRAAAIGWAR